MVNMDIAVVIFAGLLGSVVGSFVGAMVWRMKNGLDFVKGRSECEHCHHRLSALDLIPIASWLYLKGRCRYCHSFIGWTALSLEILLALAFVLSFMFWPLGNLSLDFIDVVQILALLAWLVCVTIMSALTVYDAKWKLLPNKLVLILVGFALALNILNNIFIQDFNLLNWFLEIIYSMAPITGVYGLIYLFSGGSMVGLGDVKLGVALGLILGWKGALVVLILSNLLGSLLIIPQLLRKRINIDTQIPFGPFLIASTFVVFLFQPQILEFATNSLLLL